ncbi:G2/M phase-specific E3 ubiquitin-protein ligase-like [Dendronephthya gigantea]|uniref:G2/M phase-specific E3 ubiquitin-protein ligase-like n=1 Tax=Dendronephthya gigantea TaxID=151771 RepID=UPI00106A88D4|nr:G2/M phase-specific E3 ubiquitin-protein ligase-like [Dendronephthya gigantea]
MNNVNPEELGRIVANAVASYLQPNVVNSERPQRNEGNSTVDSARQSTSSATGQLRNISSGSSNVANVKRPTQIRLPTRYQTTSLTPTSNAPTKRRTTGGVGKIKTWSKDVICLPGYGNKELTGAAPVFFSIPRGPARAKLTEDGLVGKIRIVSTWTPRQVAIELTSIFGKRFVIGENGLLEYNYLSMVPGTKRLKIPNVSTSFTWNGQEVASLAGQGCLYIVAKSELIKNDEDTELQVDLSDDEPSHVQPQIPNSERETITSDSKPSSSSSNEILQRLEIDLWGSALSHRSYVSLLDDDCLSDDSDDILLHAALEESRREVVVPCQSIKDILKAHINDVMSKQEGKNYINVRRAHVLEDSIAKIRKTKFNPKLPISVKFADDEGNSEGAVDTGGPTREFFRLLTKEMFSKSSMFGGADGNKVLIHNIQARAQGLYKSYGMLLSLSLCNGGNACHCLNESVYDFLVYGEDGKILPTIDDIHYHESKSILLKVLGTKTEEEFLELTQQDDFLDMLSACGYSARPSFGDKDKLLSMVARYFVLDKPRSALEQFKEGLETLAILDAMKRYPEEFKGLFCFQATKLTAPFMQTLFSIAYSPNGSNSRAKEELIVMHWRDFLQDCEAGEARVSLEDVLIFATGAGVIPPCGFEPQTSATFWDDVRPRGNTCANTICLPTWPTKESVSFEEFKDLFEDGILNSPGFQRA